jgi:hypothetical protein
VRHRPDLGVQTGSGPVAIEVELQRKVRARLLDILRMYEEQTQDDGTLAGVIYVCDRNDVADAVSRAARRRLVASAGAELPHLARRHRADTLRSGSPQGGAAAACGVT